MKTCLLFAAVVLGGCASAPNGYSPPDSYSYANRVFPNSNRINADANRGSDADECQRAAQARYPDRPADGMQCVRIGNVTNCTPTRSAGGWAAGFNDMDAALGRPKAERACMVAKGW